MQYLFLLYGDESAELAMTPEERRAMYTEHAAYAGKLRDRGAMIAGDALTETAQAVVVRDGVASDGPFAETKEQLGGYYVVEAASREEAIALAREVPRGPGAVVEIRPLATT